MSGCLTRCALDATWWMEEYDSTLRQASSSASWWHTLVLMIRLEKGILQTTMQVTQATAMSVRRSYIICTTTQSTTKSLRIAWYSTSRRSLSIETYRGRFMPRVQSASSQPRRSRLHQLAKLRNRNDLPMSGSMGQWSAHGTVNYVLLTHCTRMRSVMRRWAPPQHESQYKGLAQECMQHESSRRGQYEGDCLLPRHRRA
mmetsp:Transcript_31678/g.78945  ORF Transcript_31678/g.78945 Transcript_31678/m.78945 type:complete len:200 (+) Transcript_31678:269-868(+)